METEPLVTMLVGGLAASFVLGYFAQKVRIPLVLAYMAAGIVAGPHVLGASAEPELVQELTGFALILMMFGVALRFPPRQRGLFRWAVILAVAIQAGLTIALAYAA